MKAHIRWPGSIEQARRLQESMRGMVKILHLRRAPRLIAGLDAAFKGAAAVGAACLYSFPGLELIEQSVHVARCRFPYVPGYLTFREGPALLGAMAKLRQKPDLLLFDGQGIAHPRQMGIASHLGVLLGVPSVGCAKSRLTGEYREPGSRRGMTSPLRAPGVKGPIGAVVRTRDGVRPLFVSPGHLIDVEGAARIVLGCSVRFRVPEPIRCADRASKNAAKVLQ